MSRGWIRIFTFRCPEVGSYFVTFVVVAAAAVSVVIWRYAIGRSLLIWNGLMMQLIIFFSRTLGRLARGARRRLSRLWISICNIDIKTRWLNPREEFDESSSVSICFWIFNLCFHILLLLGVVVSTLMFRCWFRLFIFKCPKVGLGFSFLGVQKLDYIFHF